jgi:hypothetical protein
MGIEDDHRYKIDNGSLDEKRAPTMTGSSEPESEQLLTAGC